MVERLKKEEEERQARRKRVEAIMKRTRNAAPNANKTDLEKGEEDGAQREKEEEPKSGIEAFLHTERVSSEASLTNGQESQTPSPDQITDSSNSDPSNNSDM